MKISVEDKETKAVVNYFNVTQIKIIKESFVVTTKNNQYLFDRTRFCIIKGELDCVL